MRFIVVLFSVVILPKAIASSDFYSVDSAVQSARTNLAKEECQKFLKLESLKTLNESTELRCPTIFDKIMCWKSMKTNLSISKMCPNYLNGFKVNGKVHKNCNKNGVWSKTDYSGCVQSDMWNFITNNATMTKIDLVENLGSVGYGLSILCLITAIGIMAKFRKLRCTRNTIHIHLFISFLLRGCFHFLRMTYDFQDPNIFVCKFLVVLENFLIEASYTWVFIEALYLHNTIFVHVLSEDKAWLWIYVSLGWGLPCLVMCVLVGARTIFEDTGCWIIDNLNISRWIMISYPIITIMCNVLFFVNIIRELYVKIRQEVFHEQHRYRKLTKSTFILILLFGLYHLIFIPVELHDTKDQIQPLSIFYMVKLYYTHLFVTFQGLIVAFLFCFLNTEVINELKKHLRHPLAPNVSRIVEYKHMADQNRAISKRKNNSRYLLQPLRHPRNANHTNRNDE